MDFALIATPLDTVTEIGAVAMGPPVATFGPQIGVRIALSTKHAKIVQESNVLPDAGSSSMGTFSNDSSVIG